MEAFSDQSNNDPNEKTLDHKFIKFTILLQIFEAGCHRYQTGDEFVYTRACVSVECCTLSLTQTI